MQAANKEHLYKLLVIGDLGVGKTSIIKRYVHQNFSSHYRATIGVDFALKVLHWDPDTVVRLQLWDIAGESPGRRSPAPGSRVAAQGGEPGLRGRCAERDASWWAGNLVSKKRKSFSLSLKLAARSVARGAVAVTASRTRSWEPSAPRGPLRTQRETLWSCIRFLASSSFSGLWARTDLLGTGTPSVMPAFLAQANRGGAPRPVHSGNPGNSRVRSRSLYSNVLLSSVKRV